MEGRLFCFLLALQIVIWTSATSRPLAPSDGFDVHQPGQNPQSSQVSIGPSSNLKAISFQGFKSKQRTGTASAKVESKLGIGSSPPNCEHKCYGCIPCEAIQVPTTSKQIHVDLQYANYEPESWKCKCGPSFYTP